MENPIERGIRKYSAVEKGIIDQHTKHCAPNLLWNWNKRKGQYNEQRDCCYYTEQHPLGLLTLYGTGDTDIAIDL